MYESPIEIFKTEIEYKIENEIMSMLQKQGVTIDKDELLRALNYDRDQYNKGYADGKIAAIDEIVRCKDCRFWKEESVENADTHIPLEELLGVKLPIKSVGIGICECEKFYGDCEDERLKLYRAFNPLETTKDDFCSFGERSEYDE